MILYKIKHTSFKKRSIYLINRYNVIFLDTYNKNIYVICGYPCIRLHGMACMVGVMFLDVCNLPLFNSEVLIRTHRWAHPQGQIPRLETNSCNNRHIHTERKSNPEHGTCGCCIRLYTLKQHGKKENFHVFISLLPLTNFSTYCFR